MISIADILTDETKITPKVPLPSLHSEIAAEERFLRELEKAKKVYFDWGYHWFFVRLDSNVAWENSDNWVNANPDNILKLAGLSGITSADTVAKIAEFGVEVIICNASKWSFKTEGEENTWLARMKEFYPNAKVSFYKKTE
jgi:hypothetical protein